MRRTLIDFVPRHHRGVGNWSGHQPFAYTIVGELRPTRFVELGTHYGESYFTFCQSVLDNEISCECFAVDTWQGDSQTGYYADSVHDVVRHHNARHYAEFSQLLRMTFDEALTHFDDESIDLLHIDGLHTYEAVKHDFETWFPKVRPGGIVLFHDTAVRDRGFGVWRLWDELSARYTSHQFTHSHGLGVMRKPGGTALPEGMLRELLAEPPGTTRIAVADYFLLLGQNVRVRQIEDGSGGSLMAAGRSSARTAKLKRKLRATRLVAAVSLLTAVGLLVRAILS